MYALKLDDTSRLQPSRVDLGNFPGKKPPDPCLQKADGKGLKKGTVNVIGCPCIKGFLLPYPPPPSCRGIAYLYRKGGGRERIGKRGDRGGEGREGDGPGAGELFQGLMGRGIDGVRRPYRLHKLTGSKWCEGSRKK